MYDMFKLLKAILLISFLWSNIALAGNLNFMDNSSVSFFQGKDMDMMVNAAVTALNTYKDGKKLIWKNNATGTWGYVIPSHTTKKNGMICRNLTIFTNAKNVTDDFTYKLCKINNEWKILAR